MQHQVDRFYSAVLVLAGDGNIKQRLISAYAENLDDISEEDLPGNIKADFIDLKHELKSVPEQHGEGAVCATVRKMSAEQASSCARRLLALYSGLMALREESAPERPAAVKQPVLVKSVS
jgi:hypothetical protein